MLPRHPTLLILLALVFVPAAPSMNIHPGSPPALAQEADTTVKGALADKTPPAQLDRVTLRKRLKAMREAIKARNFANPAERRFIRDKMKAYRTELRARRAGKPGALPPGAEPRQQAPAAKQEAPAPDESTMPETQGGGEPPAGAKTPKTDSSGSEPAAASSTGDCDNLWDDADKDLDDTLSADEARPFRGALAASGGGSGETISKPEFMDACSKGTFKGIKP
jgi:hypothetical protein